MNIISDHPMTAMTAMTVAGRSGKCRHPQAADHQQTAFLHVPEAFPVARAAALLGDDDRTP